MKRCIWLWVSSLRSLTLLWLGRASKFALRSLCATVLVLVCSCQSAAKPDAEVPCAEALIAYAEQYPEAEATDLYKLVFQDLYGPGHLITDSASCAAYIQKEVDAMAESALFPLFEYTLCDSNFVRVNLKLVKDGHLSVRDLTRAVLCSAEGMATPDPKFVQSHSAAFKAAYDPHYRIVRRDIFEKEILPKLKIES